MRLSLHRKITKVCKDVYGLCLSCFTNLSLIVHYHKLWESPSHTDYSELPLIRIPLIRTPIEASTVFFFELAVQYLIIQDKVLNNLQCLEATVAAEDKGEWLGNDGIGYQHIND